MHLLEDGDLTLFESRAITSYVSEKYKEQGSDLMKHDNLLEAASVKQWMEVESQNYNPNIQPIIYQVFVVPLQGKEVDQAIIDTHVNDLSKVLDIYEARLTTTKYLAGDLYSLADLHCIPYTFYLMKTEFAKLINDRPHVKAWWEDISSRPAFLKVAENMKFGGNCYILLLFELFSSAFLFFSLVFEICLLSFGDDRCSDYHII
ncbi:hypothetical protein V2J09_011223 [Rumex salicifolius]